MKHVKIADLNFCQFKIFEKYPELIALSTTRNGGVSKGAFLGLNLGLHVGDNIENVLENRRLVATALNIAPNDFTCPEQTHSAYVHVVTANEKGRGATEWKDGFPNADALITNVPGIPLAVLTADCAPVFLFDPVTRSVGIVHAGRKGTEGEIVLKTIEKMHDTFGTCAENLITGIGPCIYPCCYPVDLPGQIKSQLISAGVKPENIEESNICTSCQNDLFFSYRADGQTTGRLGNIIILK